HADASWADDQAMQRSSQGYTFSLGSGSVSWRSTRSSSVLGSSCEAEIYAGAMAAQELRWLTYLLTDLGEPPRSPPVLYVDNKAMLALCREHRLEHRTKHIGLRYFLAHELQQRGQLHLAYVASQANTADIFTKALPPGDLQRFCTMLVLAALTCGPRRPYLRPRRPYLRTPLPLPAASPHLPAAPSPLLAAPPPLPVALPPLPAAPPPLRAAPPPLPAASPRLPAVPAALNCGLAAPSLRPRRPYLRPPSPPPSTAASPPLPAALPPLTCGPCRPHQRPSRPHLRPCRPSLRPRHLLQHLPPPKPPKQPSRPTVEQPSRPVAEPPSSRAAQQPSRPAAKPPSSRAALQSSRQAAQQPSSRTAQQQSRRAAEPPSRPTSEPSELPCLVSIAPLSLHFPFHTVCVASLLLSWLPPSVLAFDAEGRAIDFDVWVDDLQLFLQCDRADGLSLFDLTSGASPAPAADADATVRSQWATRDAAARLAVRRQLPTSERAHFSQYKSAQTLYDAVVVRYSSPATAALSRLLLPSLFPDLAAFSTGPLVVTRAPPSLRGAPPPPFCPLLPLSLRPTSLGLSRSVRCLPLAGDAALARAKGVGALEARAGAVEVEVEAAGGVGVAVGVEVGVEVSVAAVEAEAVVAVAVGVEVAEEVAMEEAAEAAGVAVELVAGLRRGVAPVVVRASRSSAVVKPCPLSSSVSGTLHASGVGALVRAPTSCTPATVRVVTEFQDNPALEQHVTAVERTVNETRRTGGQVGLYHPPFEKCGVPGSSLQEGATGPSGSGGVRGAGEARRGVAGGSSPITSVSTPAKDDVKAFNLEKFSGKDWASWSFRMELLFNHYGLLEVMDGELKRPASEGATKELDRRSKDGFFLLSQCLSSNQLHHIKHLIKDIQCGPKAWKILKDVHAPSSEAMVVVLERQLHAVKINEGDAVQGAFDQLRDLYVKLSAAGVDYPEKIKCYKALSLLPESWGPLVVNLNGMKDSWSLEWIRAQVLQEDFRRKELTAAAGEGGGSAYGMKGFKGRGSKKGKFKEGSGGEQYSGGKRSNKGGKRCGGKCWYCHVDGHPWFKCRKLPDGWRPGQPSIEGSKGVHGAMGEGMGSEEGDGGAGGHGGMFYHVGEACSEDMVVPASKAALHRSSHWVIDTGAFMTMTNREDLLDEVWPSKAATVVSATGQVVPVRGEGRAMFMGADGRLVGLKRVLLVPGLCANLLSTKALSEAGMKMKMMGTKVFKATLDGRVLWDLRGGKDMHRSMWEIPVLPWKEAAARLAAEAVREGHASHVTSGGGGDGSDGGLLVHGGGALPSVTPSTVTAAG
ncbi:unnamed protein product, partial [Closterium sp. NIES-54]